MLDPIKNSKQIIAGFIGEGIARDYLASKNIPFFQVDLMILKNGVYRLVEIKYQEIYEPGPNCRFYGTGLPIWQVEARMAFYHQERIEPWLCVVEKSDYEKKEGYHLIWLQSLVVLEMSKYIDTQGKEPRRVYDIKSFNKIYFAKRKD